MRPRTKILVATAVVVSFAAVFVTVPAVKRRTVNPDAIRVFELVRSVDGSDYLVVSNASSRSVLIRYSPNNTISGVHAANLLATVFLAPGDQFHIFGQSPDKSKLSLSVSEEFKGFDKLVNRVSLFPAECYAKLRGKEKKAVGSSSQMGNDYGHETKLFVELNNAGTNRIATVHK